jgi:hypothetical protein
LFGPPPAVGRNEPALDAVAVTRCILDRVIEKPIIPRFHDRDSVDDMPAIVREIERVPARPGFVFLHDSGPRLGPDPLGRSDLNTDAAGVRVLARDEGIPDAPESHHGKPCAALEVGV